jgi:hypothetical protein
MAFALSDAALPVPESVRSALRREWHRLAMPGTWLRGDERIAVAGEARAARTSGESGAAISPLLVEAAHSVSAAAQFVTRDWVEDLLARGLRVEEYVEAIGVVARLAAVDAYVRAVGAHEEELPEAIRGEPVRAVNDEVRWRGAFVPTAPADGASHALSAVPAELDAMWDLHSSLYLSEEQMADLGYRDRLLRPQMEFLAARVSHLNDCFY